MFEEKISEDEISKERTPSELISWVETKINSVDEKAIRLRLGLAKELVEEVFPLAIFAFKKYGDTSLVRIKPVIGNQNYDAILTDNSYSPAAISYVEITQAHEGETEHLRALYLQEHGWVPVTGTIKKTGTKKTGLKVSARPVAESVIISAESELKRVLEAIKKKESKNYPANTCLVVEFNDGYMIRRAVDNIKIDSFIQANLVGINLQFKECYLVGKFKEIFRQYKLIHNNGRIERVEILN